VWRVDQHRVEIEEERRHETNGSPPEKAMDSEPMNFVLKNSRRWRTVRSAPRGRRASRPSRRRRRRRERYEGSAPSRPSGRRRTGRRWGRPRTGRTGPRPARPGRPRRFASAANAGLYATPWNVQVGDLGKADLELLERIAERAQGDWRRRSEPAATDPGGDEPALADAGERATTPNATTARARQPPPQVRRRPRG
jgi:hypothetical protein